MSAEEEDRSHRRLVNEEVRVANREGLTILQMLEDDLVEAWRAYYRAEPGKKQDTARGRVRGLSQAIATLRSPYSRGELPTARWHQVIVDVERAAERLSRG